MVRDRSLVEIVKIGQKSDIRFWNDFGQICGRFWLFLAEFKKFRLAFRVAANQYQSIPIRIKNQIQFGHKSTLNSTVIQIQFGYKSTSNSTVIQIQFGHKSTLNSTAIQIQFRHNSAINSMAIHIKFRYNSDIIQIQFNCKFNSNSDTILKYNYLLFIEKNPNF